MKVEFIAKLPAKVIRRKNWYLATCPVLDIHSQGDSAEEAKKNLVEALSLFFISCFERGTLDAALKECGFRPGIGGVEPSVNDENFIDVPIPFLTNDTSIVECHA